MIFAFRIRAVLLFFLLLSISGAAPAEPSLRGVGKLVIAGGGMTSSSGELWDLLLAGRLGARPIGIISTASADPASVGLPLAESLNRERGEGSVVFLPLGEEPGKEEDPETLALIRTCGGFFFTGGQQERTVRALKEKDGSRTAALEAIWQIYLQGGIIGGTSAGAAIMSDPMITGGSSADALLRGATPAGTGAGERGVGYGSGLGFHPGVLYCQHHLERGRFGRLLAALVSETLEFQQGLGISEDTAWVVDPASETGTVIGARGVVFLDSSGKILRKDGGFGGVRVHYLERGDSLHFPSGKIVPGPGKTEALRATTESIPTRTFAVADAWSRDAMRQVLWELAEHSDLEFALAHDPNFDLKFHRTGETRVWRQAAAGHGGNGGWTVSNLEVEVLPREKPKREKAPKVPDQIAGSGPLPEGKARFPLSARGKTLEVFTYRPAAYRDGPLFIVMHGLNRNADTYRDNAIPLGDRFQGLVVAPVFSLELFPTEEYQRGGVTLDGEPRAMEDWTFQFIGEVVAAVREREGRPDLPYYLIGHSAGGQFLNRLAAFLPGDAVRIVSANPGSLIFPTRELPFQYGFGNLPEHWSDDAWLKRYLAAPLTLYLGSEDIQSRNLDLSDEAMHQGSTRIERGRACFSMAAALARERGWPFHWTLVEAEGIGHDSAGMFSHPQAEEAIFGGTLNSH